MVRTFALVLIGSVMIACSSSHEHSEPPAPPPPVKLPDVQGVPALEDENPDPNIVEVSINAEKTKVDLGDGKTVAMLGYNGQNPGPMLKAKVGDEVIVHFHNSLTTPTTIHWHGLRIPDAMDGSPRVQEPVPPNGDFTYRFKVPEAGSFWYHPHVKANEQVEAGLYAPIVIIDPNKDPTYDVERYLMLDDLLLGDSGRIVPPILSGMDAMHGRSGNILLTNGTLSKNARAAGEQGSVERWRLVNTANARTMELEIEGASFRIIGTDGGLLAQPYKTKRITLPVGQRYDVEVTYENAGPVTLKSIVLELDANDKVIEVPQPVFQVDVAASAKVPREIVWPEINPVTRAPDADATIAIDAINGANGVEWRLNGKSHSMEPLFTFRQGQAVRIKLENKLGPEHPFHLHGQFFEIQDKKQPGLKDTVLVPGMSTVEIVAYMDNPGRWMAHCHILEHSELGMMSEIVVTAADGTPPTPPKDGNHDVHH
jgi:FtsP/CotA-like multicopper oxidase with cupredoxin domain